MAAYAAAASLNRQVSTVLSMYDVLLPPLVRKTYEFAVKELKSFQTFVERLDLRSRKRMDASLKRVTEAMSEFVGHFMFDVSIIQSTDPVGHEEFTSGIHSIVEQLKMVEKEYYNLPRDDVDVTSSSSSSSRGFSESKMVGLRDQRRLLKDEVIDPFFRNTVSLVVGMAGVGKTTLTREIYEDLDISELFDCRAWVRIGGDEWRSKEIKEAILAQVDPEAYEMVFGGDGEKIGKKLKDSLKGKRYLIVLDYVWSHNIDEYFLTSFPDIGNGSRVLLTTRMKYVGIEEEIGRPFEVRLLDKEESWDLLRDKVFNGIPCPAQLEKVGRKIAEKCDGLPLTILTVADLLSEAEESVWIDVAIKKKHQLFLDAYDQISKVLYPSYKALPDNLKVCFLYMGVFPQKYEINKSKLINLWIVEKFLEPSSDQTLESHAVEILEFLDVNGVVMVYERNSSNYKWLYGVNVKKCGLHSSWWHFCQIEARKINCFLVLDCYNEDSIEEDIKGHSRLSIHYNVLFAIKHVHNSIEEICASTARSLLCLGPYSQYMVPICFGLRFLLRLDALNIRFYDFPLEVLELVKLRYLALTCNGSLPPSISNLQKLQYLIVHPHLSIKSFGALSNLPVEIWDLKRLKHLQVMGYDLPDLGDTSSLQNLITLSGVTISSCIILNKVPNLKKLGIIIELPPDSVESLCFFDHIFHLTKLESLKCVIVNPEWKFDVVPPISHFPSLPFSLTKLHLSGLGYPWEEMGKIASLPNLQVLKLLYNAFRGPEWEVEENGFPDLRSLLIEDMDLVKLKWAHGSFKTLEVLRIKHCYKLRELHLGEPPEIQDIEVVECGPLVEWQIKHNILEGLCLLGPSVHSSWKS